MNEVALHVSIWNYLDSLFRTTLSYYQYFPLFYSVSGNVEKLMKPGSSFEHVARWLTFCGAQPPFCNVSEKIPSQNSGDNSAQLGVSVFVIKEKPLKT